MYTIIIEWNHESEKSKGINKNVIDDELKYEDYENVLINRSNIRHEVYIIHKDVYNKLSHFNKSIL